MLSFIKSLRKKTKAERDRLAFYGASIVTILIATAWALTLPGRYEHINELPLTEAENDTSGGFARALGDVKSQLGAVIDGLKQPEATEATDTAATSSYTLDVEAVFNEGRATSTLATSTATATPVAAVPRVVLIATTSATSTAPAVAQ